MLKLFLWLRYLHKKKIVFLSITAVALSVALLIVVASLFTGFINALEQSAVEVMGDIVLSPPVKFAKYQQLIERLEQINQVKAATAVLRAHGLLHLGEGNVRAVEIWGIEPQRRAAVTDFKQTVLRERKPPKEPLFEAAGTDGDLAGFVGIGVIAEPDEKTDEYDFDLAGKMIGRQAALTTGAELESDAGGEKRFKRKTIRFTITDIVFTGIYEIDKTFVYLPIEQLQKYLYPDEDGQIAGQIQIKLKAGASEEVALAQIRGVWQDFATEQLGWNSRLIQYTDIETSKQMQSRDIAEFRKQMGILLLIFGVISLSAVLLIFCIFYMIVITRQKDIAVVKSCGVTNGSVALVFIGFGACVGLVGSAAGMLLGYVIIRDINTVERWIRIIFGLKLWKSSVYIFSKIPSEIDWAAVWPIVVSAVVAAAAGALIPAIIAARTRPVNVLRYE